MSAVEEVTIEENYFEARMNLLGISAKENRVQLLQYVAATDGKLGKNELVETPIFSEVDSGIKILVYTLDRCAIPYAKEGNRNKNDKYAIVRLKSPPGKKER